MKIERESGTILSRFHSDFFPFNSHSISSPFQRIYSMEAKEWAIVSVWNRDHHWPPSPRPLSTNYVSIDYNNIESWHSNLFQPSCLEFRIPTGFWIVTRNSKLTHKNYPIQLWFQTTTQSSSWIFTLNGPLKRTPFINDLCWVLISCLTKGNLFVFSPRFIFSFLSFSQKVDVPSSSGTKLLNESQLHRNSSLNIRDRVELIRMTSN